MEFKIDFTNVLLITGKRGTGKTFCAKWLFLERYKNKGKVLIYDPLFQYGELGHVCKKLSDLQHCDLRDYSKAIVFYPDGIDNKDTFDAVADFCYRAGNIVFMVDELNEYMSPSFIPEKFRQFVRRGRNFGCGFVGIIHRPAYISLNFLNMIDHWFIFQQDLERDLDRLVEYLERAKPEYDQDFIAELPDRHFIYMSRDRETGKTLALKCDPLKIKDSSINTKTAL